MTTLVGAVQGAECPEHQVGAKSQRLSRRRSPHSTSSTTRVGKLPTFSDRRRRSIDAICETLATEVAGRPVTFEPQRTFPGAAASLMLEVSGTTTTV